ncbi:HGxxPAAW family protein [Herbiconiux sp. 11R-BC]|uniref:HGxxPAAW family protein n=1 Tax=Herbiconiux sp. 11R-BC TaxID=3111637 RepID=UPI0010F79A00
MSSEIEELGEGHSPAAWTLVVVSLLGIALGTVAFFLEIAWLVWVGVAITLIGFLLGWVLGKAGYGVGGSRVQHKEH